MSGYRTIPFGYQIERCLPVLNQQESDIVKSIYSSYLAGESYATIAARLSEGKVEYHAGAGWNKHMVKRILENSIYTGSGEYPEIVPMKTFLAIQQLRARKTAGTTAPPPYLAFLRGRIVCGCCGAPLKRDIRHPPATWKCDATECKQVRIRENSIVDTITACMKLICNGSIEIQKSAKGTSPDSRELFQIRNQLTREMGKLDINEDAVCQLLLQEASETYALCQDGSDTKYERMMKALHDYDTNTLDLTNLPSILHKLVIQPGSYMVELVTEQEIALK